MLLIKKDKNNLHLRLHLNSCLLKLISLLYMKYPLLFGKAEPRFNISVSAHRVLCLSIDVISRLRDLLICYLASYFYSSCLISISVEIENVGESIAVCLLPVLRLTFSTLSEASCFIIQTLSRSHPKVLTLR